jgi:hypothetical protein
MLPVPGMKIGCHVEVFHDDPTTGKRTLVHTSRPREVCGECGQPLARFGLVTATTKGTPICPACRRDN